MLQFIEYTDLFFYNKIRRYSHGLKVDFPSMEFSAETFLLYFLQENKSLSGANEVNEV